jgi:hypothetical protein
LLVIVQYRVIPAVDEKSLSICKGRGTGGGDGEYAVAVAIAIAAAAAAAAAVAAEEAAAAVAAATAAAVVDRSAVYWCDSVPDRSAARPISACN